MTQNNSSWKLKSSTSSCFSFKNVEKWLTLSLLTLFRNVFKSHSIFFVVSTRFLLGVPKLVDLFCFGTWKANFYWYGVGGKKKLKLKWKEDGYMWMKKRAKTSVRYSCFSIGSLILLIGEFYNSERKKYILLLNEIW